MTDYPYGRDDPLQHPANYSFSPFLGRDFLLAWEHNRRLDIPSLPCPAIDPALAAGDPASTAVLTERAMAEAECPSDHGPCWQLLRKFETTKRLYRRYGPDMIADKQSGCDDLSLYLRFAEAMDVAARATGRLQFVNVLLKVMDTLVALSARLDEDQLGRLARLAESERKHVDSIVTRLAPRA